MIHPKPVHYMVTDIAMAKRVNIYFFQTFVVKTTTNIKQTLVEHHNLLIIWCHNYNKCKTILGGAS